MQASISQQKKGKNSLNNPVSRPDETLVTLRDTTAALADEVRQEKRTSKMG